MTGFHLSQAARDAGYRVASFDTVGSTSTEALRAGEAGDPGKLWLAALGQTEGKGRRGRKWENPYGNLAASLLVMPDAPPTALASLGFVAGVALSETLADLVARQAMMTGAADTRPIALKWPNDVLADGAKLAGILLEAHKTPDGRPMIVVGIGVNVVSAPTGLPYAAAALSAFVPAIDAASVFESLADRWVRWYDIWNNGSGTAQVMARWRENAAGIGAPVTVQRNTDVLRGTFESIDDAGHLIVRDDDGHRIAVSAGDVYFGATATLR